MHIPCGYNAYQARLSAKSEGYVQASAALGVTERVESQFLPAVPLVRYNEKRFVEKHLFCFGLPNRLLLCVLAAVAVVPVETLDFRPIDHARILL